MLKDDLVTFIAHVNVTIKHLTRYKQKGNFGRHVGGQEYALQHGGAKEGEELALPAFLPSAIFSTQNKGVLLP